MTLQFIRKVGLVVGQSSGGNGLDLSSMQIHFQVSQQDTETPSTAIIRVFNLSDNTEKMIQKEFQNVVLQAGYEGEGNYGQIFTGTIKQFKRGRLNAKDSYLDILAADGDKAYNFALVNKSLAAGSSVKDRVETIGQAFEKYDVSTGTLQGLDKATAATGGVLPRGKVMFGLAKDQLGAPTATAGVSWNIQDGKLVTTPLTGYAPGEAIVLNSRTGMIGTPEATQNGIEVQCLLNPKIRIGTRVQIDNKLINQSTVKEQGFPRYTDLSFPATVTADGYYRVLVVEHEGECPYGESWTSTLTCLAVNQSSSPDTSVLPYG
jgi:archaellin